MRFTFQIQVAIWLVCFLGMSGSKLYGHLTFPFKQLGIEDGLPSTEVYDVYQSSDGYMWMATDHGLCRYDGREFKVFTTDDGLTDNTIFDIREYEGRLWLLTYSGGICWYKNGKIRPYDKNERLQEFLGNLYVDNMIFDSTGHIYLTTSLSNVIEATILVIKPTGALGKASDKKRQQLGDVEDNLQLDLEGLISLREQVDQEIILPDYERNYLEHSSGCTFFSFANYLYCLSADRQRFSLLEFPEKIKALYEDSDGEVWVGEARARGVYRLRGPDWSMQQAELYLPGKSITDIFEDREGHLWFGTIESGVFILNTKGIHILHSPLEASNRKILSMEKWRDTLWLGTYEGNLLWINQSWDHGEDDYGALFSIYDILSHSDDFMLLSSRLGRRDHWEVLIFKEGSVNTKDLLERRDGSIWMGGMRGLKRIDVLDYPTILEEPPMRFFKCVYALHEDEQARLWIGALSGLYLLEDDRLQYLGQEDSLLQYRITDIVERKPGQLLLATKGAGLLIWEDGEVRQITEKDGLNSIFTKTLFLQGDSLLWVGSNKGLNRIVLAQGDYFKVRRIEGYDASDGLTSAEVNAITTFKGKICLGTGKGFALLDESFFRRKLIAPPLIFTGFSASGDSFSLEDSLELRYDQHDVQIHFIGLSFSKSEKVRYQYRLVGYDEDWHYTHQNSINYTNLSPGTYRLQMRAASPQGVWNDSFKELSFEIFPHFTDTWWFRLSVFLLGLVLLGALVFFIIRRQQVRAALGRRVIESEQQALRSQINPHFIFNAMNSIQYFITENDKHNAGLYLTRFSRLIRRILENSKKNLVSLEEELEGIRTYLALEKLRFGDKFDYELDVHAEIDPYEVELPSMLVQPFLENSIWHGLMPKDGQGRLQIRFFIQKNYLMCEIEDDGIGRKAAGRIKRNKPHKSMGVVNVRERIRLLNRLHQANMKVAIIDLHDDRKEPRGTLVRIRFLSIESGS